VITIVDYGLGNISAFLNVFRRLNIPVRTACDADDLADAAKVILPGVGHFDQAMERLQQSGMREPLDALARDRRVPVLGVCVGMQMLAERSAEGELPGLGWIPGRVRDFGTWPPASGLPLPHMGWNEVRSTGPHPLLAGLGDEARFYFLHSYFFECTRPEHRLASARYGDEFSCVVGAGNIFGVQFHPEKSHHTGTRLLRNFAEL
jgi:glutamine amidotransferase